MNHNIIITSAGKRVSLVQMFQKELCGFDASAKVFTTDMNPMMAPAGHVSDGCFAVPRVTDSNYVDTLIDICINNNISIIIPTIDTELVILSANKQRFIAAGITPLVSDLEFINVCRDKRQTMTFFENHDIHVPALRDKYNPVFPMFAKPYDGSLSQNIHVIKSLEDLTTDVMNDPKLVFMEYIDKNLFKEFTVDMYYGIDNRVKSIVPRERVEVRAGEINKGITRKNKLVSFLKQRLNYLPGVVGCICVQLFYAEAGGKVYGIEINPRFGGGYPLSYHAGANYPQNIISEYLLRHDVGYDEMWADNTIMLRYDAEVIIHSDTK